MLHIVASECSYGCFASLTGTRGQNVSKVVYRGYCQGGASAIHEQCWLDPPAKIGWSVFPRLESRANRGFCSPWIPCKLGVCPKMHSFRFPAPVCRVSVGVRQQFA